ncbi:hypothetical protein ACJX0J_017393, partial [Zea mays]
PWGGGGGGGGGIRPAVALAVQEIEATHEPFSLQPSADSPTASLVSPIIAELKL